MSNRETHSIAPLSNSAIASNAMSNRETHSIVPLSNCEASCTAATHSSSTTGTAESIHSTSTTISTTEVTNVEYSSKTFSPPSKKLSTLLSDLIATPLAQYRDSVARSSKEPLEKIVQPVFSDPKKSASGPISLVPGVRSNVSSTVATRDTEIPESTTSTELPEPVVRRLKSCLRSEVERQRETRRTSDPTKKVDTSMFAAFMNTTGHATISDLPQLSSNHHSQPSPSKLLPCPSESVLNVCTPIVHSKLPVKIGAHMSVGAMENRLHHSIGENKQFPPVSLAQVASVPAILDQRNVAIIHTLKSHYNSAYLGSLVSTLIKHKARYCNKKSFEVEPFVLILAPNSKVCDELYKATTCFIGKFYDVTVKTIYGSSPENENKALFGAVNGCDILITTPRCLDRLKESQLVGLSWVFHYVLERADILFDKFSKEVLDFLGYLQVISKARLDKYAHLSHLSCPELQIILSAELYNKKLETFVLNKMHKPVLVFSNFLEAAIYGRVKFSLNIVSEMEKKMEHLLGILRSCRGGGGEKVAIVCSDTSQVLCLDRYLTSLYPHTFPIHSGLNNIQLTNMVMKWRTLGPNREIRVAMGANESQAMNADSMLELYNDTPILICDDEAVARLFVQDVTVLIHYALPSNKKTMSDRFQLVKDGLVNLFDDQDGGEVHCARCHLLLDDTNDVQFHDIVSLCKRIHLDIPDRIVQVAKQVKYKREADKRNVPLCIQLLQFGQCHIGGCKYRHAIVPDIDAPVAHLPKDGMIKFNVLSVLDGSCFSIRLLEKLPPGATTWVPHRDKLSLLNLALRRHFADKNNRVTHYSPRLGDVVAVERDGGSAMVRARVVEIVSTDDSAAPSLVRLRLCDAAGKPSVYPVSKLYALPQDLKLYSDQVLLAFTTRVLPMDEDIQWNGEIVSYMESMIENLMRGEHDKYFVGKIVLSLNNIYLLDPFQCSEYLPSAKVEISHLRMRHSLLSTQRAVAHAAHLDLLYAQCAGVDGAVPEYMRDVAPQNVPLSPLVELPSPKYAHLVQDEINRCTLIGIVDPSLFFLRLTAFEPMLTKLNKEILSDVNRTSTRYCRDECSPGLLCLAPSDDKSGYNRVQITNSDDPNVAMVLFVDYSDKQDIPYDQLVPIYRPQLISNLPFQAIECCLAGVEPLDNNQWTEEAYDLLDDFNLLFVRVVSLSLQGIETKGRRYSVELFDLEDRINVNKHLVELNYAKYTEDSAVCLSQDDESVFTEIERLQQQASADDTEEEEEGQDEWQDLPDKQKYLAERQERLLNEKSSQQEEPLVIDESAFLEDEIEEFVRSLNEMQPGSFPDLKQVKDLIKPKPVQGHLKALPSTSAPPPEANNSSPTSSPLPSTSSASSQRVSNPQPAHCEDYSEPKLTLLPSDVDPNMPSLTLASYPARTQWYQSPGFVHVHFHLPGLHEKFSLRVESKFVFFYVDIEHRSYSNQLPLLCHIVPDLSEMEWNGFELRLKLVKQHPGLEWPALLQDGLDREMRWLAYHVDHLCDHEPQDEASSSDGEEPGPPLFRMQGFKHNKEREEETGCKSSSEEDNIVSVIPEDM
uniref:RNA helicase n=1 Tax=Cacopsylla melanoneura TaxID=428564 RepID=A0A8D8W7I6_9HEMI